MVCLTRFGEEFQIFGEAIAVVGALSALCCWHGLPIYAEVNGENDADASFKNQNFSDMLQYSTCEGLLTD